MSPNGVVLGRDLELGHGTVAEQVDRRLGLVEVVAVHEDAAVVLVGELRRERDLDRGGLAGLEQDLAVRR